MDKACKQQENFNKNGSKKRTYTYHQNETVKISETYNEEAIQPSLFFVSNDFLFLMIFCFSAF